MKNVFFLILACVLSSQVFADIPESLRKLAVVENKNSEAYMFLAQEAAIDTKHAAERMLEAENSSGALKILEVAVHLMPHRTDINQLKLRALETFLKITRKLEEDSVKNCALLQERYLFLKNLAPDSLAKLKLETSCAPAAKSPAPESDVERLKVPEPKIIKELEEEFRAPLVKTFPWDDVLANTFLLLRSLYGEEFRLVCEMIKGEEASCKFSGSSAEEFKAASMQYCGYVESLLEVSDGKKPIVCIYNKANVFKTTDELYKIYEKALDNKAFEDDIPTYLVLTLTMKYMNKSIAKEVLLRSSPVVFRKTKDDFRQLAMKSFRESKADISELHEISFSINYKQTFDLYQKHFRSSLKASLSDLIEDEKR